MMDVDILYAGLSAVTGTELITPSEAAARNITSAPISIDKVFEYTYKQGGSSFQDFLQHPPSEDGETEIKKSLPPEIKGAREYELQPIEIKDKVTIEDTSDDTSNEWININIETITRQVIKIRIRKHYTIAQVKESIEREDKSLPAARQKLFFNQKKLSDEVRVESIGIKDGDTLFLMIRLRGGDDGLPIVLDDGFLDPSFDHDFTNESDNGKVYTRGGEVYSRPYGWYRYALQVLHKYGDNTWLGERGTRTASTAGEWPVSYHGTSREGAEGIATQGYDINHGRRFMYGRGIYSSPDLNHVERRYATEFSKNERRYKIVLQNRVNPVNLRRVNNNQYWITDDSNIRPYGILVKEICKLVEYARTSNNEATVQQSTCTIS